MFNDTLGPPYIPKFSSFGIILSFGCLATNTSNNKTVKELLLKFSVKRAQKWATGVKKGIFGRFGFPYFVIFFHIDNSDSHLRLLPRPHSQVLFMCQISDMYSKSFGRKCNFKVEKRPKNGIFAGVGPRAWAHRPLLFLLPTHPPTHPLKQLRYL